MNNPSGFIRSIVLLGSIAVSLTGCIGEPDGLRYPVPVGVGGGSGNAPAQPNAAPVPAAPPQPLAVQGDGWNPLTETREWHTAATQEGCDDIERRFQNEGRRVKLFRIRRTKDATLPYACIFEGEDADPGYVIPPYWR